MRGRRRSRRKRRRLSGADPENSKKQQKGSEPQQTQPKKYVKMYYKKYHTAAVRQNWGGKHQIVSFGGMFCKQPKAQLYAVADKVIENLTAGTRSVSEAKAWAKKRTR